MPPEGSGSVQSPVRRLPRHGKRRLELIDQQPMYEAVSQHGCAWQHIIEAFRCNAADLVEDLRHLDDDAVVCRTTSYQSMRLCCLCPAWLRRLDTIR